MTCGPPQRTGQIWNEPGRLATAKALQQGMSYEDTAELLLNQRKQYDTIEARHPT